MAVGLTVALAIFIVGSLALVLVGPTLAEKEVAWAHIGPAFAWTWKILQGPVVFALVTLAIAPRADFRRQEFVETGGGPVVSPGAPEKSTMGSRRRGRSR